MIDHGERRHFLLPSLDLYQGRPHGEIEAVEVRKLFIFSSTFDCSNRGRAVCVGLTVTDPGE